MLARRCCIWSIAMALSGSAFAQSTNKVDNNPPCSAEKAEVERRMELARSKGQMLLRRQLADRTLRLEQVGSIAEAALSLNRVFEAAQAAADQYLESVKAQYPVQGTEFSPTANNEGAYWK